MNQILVTEKLYVTPELKRKRKFYRISFIISIFIIAILCSAYIYAEYDRNKEADIGQDILAGFVGQNEQEDENQEEENIYSQADEDVWRIIVASTEETQEEEQENKTQVTQNTQTDQYAKYTAPNGKTYDMVGRITIPKIDVDYAILAQASGDKLVELLKVSPCKFWGVNPNEIGNMSIAGHNYRNKRFFSKVLTLEVGDIIEITDLSGTKIKYSVYDKYTVNPENTDCTNPITNGTREVTLITCTNDSKQRVIVKAEEVI